MSRIFGILLAAGTGVRLGAGLPKAFVTLDGKTILERSLEALASTASLSSIVVTVPKELLSDPLCKSIQQHGHRVIAGGSERQQSVAIALCALRDNYSPKADEYVLIHDAARCFVTTDIIERSIVGVREHQAVSVGIPSSDSLKEIDEHGVVRRSLNRNLVWRVQTPQVFRFDLITRAHENAGPGATDDAALVERIHPVQMILGDEGNRKITTPHDL